MLERAKQEASRRGTTLTALIDEGLRLVLARSRATSHHPRVNLPVCRAGGGTLPGIDLNESATLLEAMERRE